MSLHASHDLQITPPVVECGASSIHSNDAAASGPMRVLIFPTMFRKAAYVLNTRSRGRLLLLLLVLEVDGLDDVDGGGGCDVSVDVGDALDVEVELVVSVSEGRAYGINERVDDEVLLAVGCALDVVVVVSVWIVFVGSVESSFVTRMGGGNGGASGVVDTSFLMGSERMRRRLRGDSYGL
mmetsp:Transcript_48746/g.77931  ORF Transcript_48746/g.77931 Transcript_48746/m.77931 type:complete len:181 (+) Transcript_48746:521-1063(+)